MHPEPVAPLRLLVADATEVRRRAMAVGLGRVANVVEATCADDLLDALWTTGPGVTLLDHDLPGARPAALVARILEVRADEAVLVLARQPHVEFYRACMRAGAHDCIDRDGVGVVELLEVGRQAAERARERARRLAVCAGDPQEAVRAHERAGGARLLTPARLASWAGTDPGLRERLVDALCELARRTPHDPTACDAAEHLGALLHGHAAPGSLLVAACAHALADPSPSDHAPTSGRLVQALVEILAARADAASGVTAGSARRT